MVESAEIETNRSQTAKYSILRGYVEGAFPTLHTASDKFVWRPGTKVTEN